MTVTAPATTQVISEFFRRFGNGDREGAAALFAPDAELSVAGANFVPWTGPRSGPAEIRQFLDSAASEVQTDEFVIDRVMADGEDGIALGHFTHRVRRTGRRFACRFALHVKVSGGLIRSYFMFEDSYAIAEAFRG